MASFRLQLLVVLCALALTICTVGGNDEPNEAGEGVVQHDCATVMGEHARTDPITKACRCSANYEIVGGRCIPTPRFVKRRELLSGKPYEKDALGPEGMPLCYGAAECAKALLEHLRPDLDALGKCLAMVGESREELKALAGGMAGQMDSLHESLATAKEQTTGLKVQNARLLSELETLSSMGSSSEKLQRSMRLMVTDNESIKRRIADVEKKIQRRRDQIAALEKKGIDDFGTCEDNLALLQDVYADHSIRIPRGGQ